MWYKNRVYNIVMEKRGKKRRIRIIAIPRRRALLHNTLGIWTIYSYYFCTYTHTREYRISLWNFVFIKSPRYFCGTTYCYSRGKTLLSIVFAYYCTHMGTRRDAIEYIIMIILIIYEIIILMRVFS